MPSAQAPEAKLSEKWDRLIDLSLRRLAYGVTAGGAVALLLCRGSHTRTAVAAFGAGAGIGSAWQQTSKEFEEVVPGMLRSPKSS
mmetsp:Transcript_9272/g.16362  ORF Transcript_9272/g.16362 Transcript_9272/m.16362 type:complete len:85 (-) Transcript_9272:611-865(-)|eukprot:CAMPEP_0119108880 /NCGR_PEP_ID=MMETSP1180-20130426/15957_1 /TAXON_ID=3052 ORGANISM="Chlamydomonas cf sp, Strain CCMP681" /NCGR_SAMPLE_ID=MMETSP1180 /ASSEMBLY_ACC=CAM_ASM_000741 /LENGTH=84 /DNA_ID=CAMNT_0007094553 /DNA_START=145 /DNA_END=399 /DNA_ORIENTATION=+